MKAAYKSALLVVRHPDLELTYEVFGNEPLIVELDLGASFDITHPTLADQEIVAQWVADTRASVDEAGVREDDPLYLAVEDQLQTVMDAYRLSDDDDLPPEMYACTNCEAVTTGEQAGDDVLCPVCHHELHEEDLVMALD